MSLPTNNRQTLQAFSDSLGLTFRHWLCFALITMVLLADGMDVTIVSHVFPSLIKEWGVSVGGGIALIVTGGFLAMGAGALLGGRLADRWGRKPVLVIATLTMGSATILGATSGDFTAFTVWRLFACVGIGAVMPLGMTLLADLVPPAKRAAFVAAGYAGVGLGTTVGAALAGSLIPTSGWRSLLVAGGVIPLVLLVGLVLLVPEAPGFYAARGEMQKARAALLRLAPEADLENLDLTAPVHGSGGGRSRSLRLILQREFALTTVLLWVFGFFSLGTQLLIAQYLPTLLQQPTPGLNTVESSAIVGTYGFASVLGGLALSAVLTKVSRYKVIGAVLAMGAMVAVFVGLWTDPGFGALLAVFSIAGLILPTGFGPTRNILATAAYPTVARATGVGATELSARIGSAAGGALGGTLIGAGFGLSSLFLSLLVPIAILLGTLAGIRGRERRSGSETRAVDQGGLPAEKESAASPTASRGQS